MNKDEKELVLYILMRNDIPSMNAGKAMAQAAHAANQFIGAGTPTLELFEDVSEWTEQGKDFGTTIVLSGDYDELNYIEKVATDIGCISGQVLDKTYPYIVNKEIAELIPVEDDTDERFELESGDMVLCRPEITCGYIFGDKNDEDLMQVVGKLPLYN